MASTIIDPIASAIVTLLQGISGSEGSLKAYKWAPGAGMASVPCGVVDMPEWERTEPDHAEDHLGALDYRIRFPVTIYVDLRGGEGALTDQARAVEYAEAFTKAVDANPTLGVAGVVEAKVVTTGPPVIQDDETRVLIQYPTVLSLLTFA